MAQLKGLKKLIKLAIKLKQEAEYLDDVLTDKIIWFDKKSERWQKSEKGQELESHLEVVATFIFDIDNIRWVL